MSIIYEPRGKAREYSELAVNLFTGCSHACRYCYCPAILRKKIGKLNHDRQREAAIDWHRFLIDVEIALEGHSYLIKRDLERFRNTPETSHGP